MPSSRAASATGGEARRRPRPRGRSGRVTTSCGRCGRCRQALEDGGGELARCRERPCASGSCRQPRRARCSGGQPRAVPAWPPCAARARCGRGSAPHRGGRSRAGSRAPPGRRPRSAIGSPCSFVRRGRGRGSGARPRPARRAGSGSPPRAVSCSEPDHSISGLIERRDRRLLVDAVDEQRGGARPAGWRPGRRRCASFISIAHALRSPRAARRRCARRAAPGCAAPDPRTCARERGRSLPRGDLGIELRLRAAPSSGASAARGRAARRTRYRSCDRTRSFDVRTRHS